MMPSNLKHCLNIHLLVDWIALEKISGFVTAQYYIYFYRLLAQRFQKESAIPKSKVRLLCKYMLLKFKMCNLLIEHVIPKKSFPICSLLTKYFWWVWNNWNNTLTCRSLKCRYKSHPVVWQCVVSFLVQSIALKKLLDGILSNFTQR